MTLRRPQPDESHRLVPRDAPPWPADYPLVPPGAHPPCTARRVPAAFGSDPAFWTFESATGAPDACGTGLETPADAGEAFCLFTDEGDLVDCPEPARTGRNRFGGV